MIKYYNKNNILTEVENDIEKIDKCNERICYYRIVIYHSSCQR